MLDELQRWCGLAGFGCSLTATGPPFRLVVTLQDDGGVLPVAVDGPSSRDDPIRLRYRFDVPTSKGAPMPADRLVRLLEAAIMQRSAMLDARLSGPSEVEMVVALYPDGVTRHSFMIAVFECQKLRQIVRREVEAALVSESAVAALAALADASDALSGAVEEALVPPT